MLLFFFILFEFSILLVILIPRNYPIHLHTYANGIARDESSLITLLVQTELLFGSLRLLGLNNRTLCLYLIFNFNLFLIEFLQLILISTSTGYGIYLIGQTFISIGSIAGKNLLVG